MVPKILVPMLCTSHELEAMLALIDKVAFQVSREKEWGSACSNIVVPLKGKKHDEL